MSSCAATNAKTLTNVANLRVAYEGNSPRSLRTRLESGALMKPGDFVRIRNSNPPMYGSARCPLGHGDRHETDHGCICYANAALLSAVERMHSDQFDALKEGL